MFNDCSELVCAFTTLSLVTLLWDLISRLRALTIALLTPWNMLISALRFTSTLIPCEHVADLRLLLMCSLFCGFVCSHPVKDVSARLWMGNWILTWTYEIWILKLNYKHVSMLSIIIEVKKKSTTSSNPTIRKYHACKIFLSLSFFFPPGNSYMGKEVCDPLHTGDDSWGFTLHIKSLEESFKNENF